MHHQPTVRLAGILFNQYIKRQQPYLTVRQHPANLFHVRSRNNLGLTKASFPLGCFLGQNMTGMGFAEFVFT
jgi:hypothetical protein